VVDEIIVVVEVRQVGVDVRDGIFEDGEGFHEMTSGDACLDCFVRSRGKGEEGNARGRIWGG